MKRTRVIVVAGTRPEVIKMAPVLRELRQYPESFEPLLVVTGQHRQMLDHLLQSFQLTTDVDLDLMEPGQTLPDLTARVITAMTGVLRKLKPDLILVQGDTTTVLGTALAAFYERVPIGHVEAGLRTYRYEAPWPEEMNRRLVDAIARWCFAPTEIARQCLLAEHIPPAAISITGNTVIDAVLMMAEQVNTSPPDIPWLTADMLAGKRLVFVTGHRRESFGPQFAAVCHALRDITDRFSDLLLVYPVHLNPHVQKPVHEILAGHPRIILTDPIDYATCVRLMSLSHLIISDSGGIQEEAPALGKCVLVTRTTTERPEGIAAGNVILVGTERHHIVDEAVCLLTDQAALAARSKPSFPYGDGKAAVNIVRILKSDCDHE